MSVTQKSPTSSKLESEFKVLFCLLWLQKSKDVISEPNKLSAHWKTINSWFLNTYYAAHPGEEQVLYMEFWFSCFYNLLQKRKPKTTHIGSDLLEATLNSRACYLPPWRYPIIFAQNLRSNSKFLKHSTWQYNEKVWNLLSKR